MRQFIILFSLVFVFCVLAEEVKLDDKELYPQKDGYIQLDEHNFISALHKFQFVFVFYYGKDKESKRLEGEVMSKMQEYLKSRGSIIRPAKVDAERETEIIRKFPVYATPQFRLYKNGKTFDYVGQCTVEKLTVWLDLAMNVPLQINTAHELQSLTKNNSVVLGCFPGKSPEAAFKNFYKVSEHFVYSPHMPLPRFAVITSASIAREAGAVSGSISVYKAFEDGAKEAYDGDTKDFEKVLQFATNATTPIVFKNHMHEYSRRLIEQTKKHQHVLFMRSDDRNFAEAFQNFKKAAGKFSNDTDDRQVTFVHFDLKIESQINAISYFHIDVNKDIPCNRMTKIDEYHSRFIPPKKDFSYQGFVDFTESVINGKVKRNIRSDELPSDWNAYDVKTVVGKYYEGFVKDKSKTVFMLFYVPKDPQSEAAIPVFNELAKEFRSNKTIKIGKMNVATNDGEIGVHVKVPTIKMFTTDGKSNTYEMSITMAAMKAFILSGGTNQVSKGKEDDNQAPEYAFQSIEETHPVDTIMDEERRRKQWEEEEKEILSKAVEHTEGHEAHDDEAHKDRHPLHHLPLEERDPKYMDPKKHADFENMHEHEEDHYEHTEEL